MLIGRALSLNVSKKKGTFCSKPLDWEAVVLPVDGRYGYLVLDGVYLESAWDAVINQSVLGQLLRWVSNSKQSP